MEPHVKSLHLTLAYQFPQSQFNALKTLVESLDPSCASSWELRLYSRDPRLATKQVHKVLYPHSPHEIDELELRIGDFIYLNSDSVDNSCDGWVEGISWLTGMTGYLPVNYTERTAESDAWTMHRVVQLSKSITPSLTSVEEIDIVDGRSLSTDQEERRDLHPGHHDLIEGSSFTEESDLSAERFLRKSLINRCVEIPSVLQSIIPPVDFENDADIDSPSMQSDKKDSSTSQAAVKNRKIYIMRHGERVDFTFGTWIPYCFDEFNNYVRKDLNMPKSLPKRKNCPEGWQNDSPLTNIGLFQAKLVGEAMFEAGVHVDHVYCSPAYRCVQTCTSALEGLRLNGKHKLHVEPGLFEWMAWYPDGVPDWCTVDELIEARYHIEKDYEPMLTGTNLNTVIKETSEEFYNRNHECLLKILEKTTGNIFIVAHATTLDTCSRQLIGENPRSTNELRQVIHKIPYCSLAVVEQINGEWKLVEPEFLPVTHSKNPRFEWNALTAT